MLFFSHLWQHASICTGVSAVGMHSLSFGCDQCLWALELLSLHGTPALSDEYHIKLIQSYHKWCHVVRYEWFRKHDMEFCGYYDCYFYYLSTWFFVGFPCMIGCDCEHTGITYYHCGVSSTASSVLKTLYGWAWTGQGLLRLNDICPQLSLLSVILSHNELRNFHPLLCNM